jgi:putative transposase
MVTRAFKYRFYPTPEQEALLNRTFGSVRYVYNRALALRSHAWLQEQKRVNYYDTSKLLTEWKQNPETEWLQDVSSVPLQQSLRHLQAAFVAFWEKRAKFPAFKSKRKARHSATFTRMAFSYRDGRVTLAKCVAPLNIRWSQPLPKDADPSSVTVSRDPAGRWHISIQVEAIVEALPAVTTTVGIDMGITCLVAMSTAEKVPNPRHERKDRARLALVQRRLSRKANGSANRFKARVKVAKVHARIADRRRDVLHKLSTRIVHENQVVIIEDLAIRNMVRNHSLARSIFDASWSEFRRQLEYKAAWYGRTVVAIDRWYPSSKTCSVCGWVATTMPLNVRSWICQCGAIHDRDVNAARNIQAAGLAVLACGDGVSPSRT